MRKLGFAIVGIIIVSALYYFVSGSEQLTVKMKETLSKELTLLQKEGFSVQNREMQKAQEHFELSFDDTTKIAHFFTRQGMQLNVNDAALLKGTKLGVDVYYLHDIYSSVSFDIYPLAFPNIVFAMAENDKEKKIFQHLLDKKTFLTHVAINKLGNGFKGNMKDVEELLQGKQNVTLMLKGVTFSGTLKQHRLSNIQEKAQNISFRVDDNFSFVCKGLESDYLRTGKTAYDYTTNYTIKNISLEGEQSFKLTADALTIQSSSRVKDGLISGSIQSTSKHIATEEKGKKYAFDDFTFEMKANHLDLSAFTKLQQIDLNNQQEVNALMQKLISKGVHFEIPTLSIANIYNADKKLGGFTLSADTTIDKSLNIDAMNQNPLLALNAIDAKLNIQLSQALFNIVAQQPQAMMAIMLFQPKDVNGQKVYEVTLKDTKVSVNGMPVN